MELKTIGNVPLKCGTCTHFESYGYNSLADSYTGSCKQLYRHLAKLNNSKILSREVGSIEIPVDFACSLYEQLTITL